MWLFRLFHFACVLYFFTFGCLPGLPKIFHANEFVFSMESAVLDRWVMVIQVLSQELGEEETAGLFFDSSFRQQES